MGSGQDVVARSTRRTPFLLGGDPGTGPEPGSLLGSLRGVLEARKQREEAGMVGDLLNRLDGSPPTAQPVAASVHATNEAVTTVSTAYNGILGAVQEHNRQLQTEAAAAKDEAGQGFAAGQSAAAEIATVALESVKEANKGAIEAISVMGKMALDMANEVRNIVVGVKDAQIAALTEAVGSQRQQIEALKTGTAATMTAAAANDPLRQLAVDALQSVMGRVKEEMAMTPQQRVEQARALAGPAAPAALSIDEEWKREQILAARSKRTQQERHADEVHEVDLEGRRDLHGALKQAPDLVQKWLPRILGGAPASGAHNGIPDSWGGGSA